MAAHVLLLEIDDETTSTLTAAFEAAGAHVTVIREPDAALEWLEAELPQLVVLSVELGEGRPSGYTLCKRLKRAPRTKEIPLFLMSSTATLEIFDQHRKLNVRAEGYFKKPVDDVDEVIREASAFISLEVGEVREDVTHGFDDELASDLEDLFDGLDDFGDLDEELTLVEDMGDDFEELNDIDDLLIAESDQSDVSEEQDGDRTTPPLDREAELAASQADDPTKSTDTPASVEAVVIETSPEASTDGGEESPVRSQAERPTLEQPDLVEHLAAESPIARAAPESIQRPAPTREVVSHAARAGAGAPTDNELREARASAEAARKEVSELREKLDEATRALSASRREAEDAAGKLAAQERTVSSLEARLAATNQTVTSVSARELLTLREQLNQRDRDLLEMKDQLFVRDRRVLEAEEARDSAAGERDLLATQAQEAASVREKIAGELDATRAQLAELEATQGDLQRRLRDAESARDEVNRTLETRAQEHAAAADQHRQRVEELERELGVARGERDAAREETKATSSELDTMREELVRSATQIEELGQNISTLTAEGDRQNAELQRREEQIEELQNESQRLSAEITVWTERASTATASLDEAQSQLKEAAEAREALVEEKAALEANVTDLQGALESSGAEMDATRAENASLVERVEAAHAALDRERSEHTEAKAELEITSTKLANALSELTESRAHNEALRTRVAELEGELAAANATNTEMEAAVATSRQERADDQAKFDATLQQLRESHDEAMAEAQQARDVTAAAHADEKLAWAQSIASLTDRISERDAFIHEAQSAIHALAKIWEGAPSPHSMNDGVRPSSAGDVNADARRATSNAPQLSDAFSSVEEAARGISTESTTMLDDEGLPR